MSVKIMGAIWDLDLPHELAWTLMAYADHADHDGRNCYPGNKLIAYKTGYSERTVQRCTAALVLRGILTVERAGGRGHTTVYRIHLACAPLKTPAVAIPDAEIGKGDILAPYSKTETEEPERVTSATERVTSATERVTSGTEKGDTAMAPQPSLTVIEPSLEPSGTARACDPEKWSIFCQEGHHALARIMNRPNMRPPHWQLSGGLLKCGIWEPEIYQAAQRDQLKVSALGQTAKKYLGRRVALEIIPAWGSSPEESYADSGTNQTQWVQGSTSRSLRTGGPGGRTPGPG
jgi:hypothetical protein